MQNIRRYVTSQRWPRNPTNLERPYAAQREKLVFGSAGELLFKEYATVKTIPPSAIWSDLLDAYHDLNGHPGEKVTIDQLNQKFFWPGISDIVKNHIRTCHQCQVTKPNLRPRKAPQGESETPKGPWEILAWDLIGPLETTDEENKYILTGFDLFSKRAYAFPIPSKHSAIVAAHIENAILGNPSIPRKILTDHGLEFADLQGVCRGLNITHVKSPPYHPQANGAVERLNQTLKNRLFSSGLSNWDRRLPRIIHGINCSKHAVTGISPFLVENGRSGENINDGIQHPLQPRMNVQRIDEQTRRKILDEKAERIDKFRNENFLPYREGDLVLIKNMTGKYPRFLGPFRIKSVRGPQLSYVVSNEFGQEFIRHVSHLKQYNARKLESFSEQDSDDQPPESSEPNMGNTTDNYSIETTNFLYAGFILRPTPLRRTTTVVSENNKNVSINEHVQLRSKENHEFSENEHVQFNLHEKPDSSDDTLLNDKENEVQFQQNDQISSTNKELDGALPGEQSSADLDSNEHVQSQSTEDPEFEENKHVQFQSTGNLDFAEIEHVQFNPNTDSEKPEEVPSNEEASFSSPALCEMQPEVPQNNQANVRAIPLDETPGPERKVSLRDRNSIRPPRRPLDENFQYSTRCSTPIKDVADSSLNGTLFATPNTSLICDISEASDCQSQNEELPTTSGHTCPKNMQSVGKRVLLSKISKPQLMDIASNLSLTSDGTRNSLMKNIDNFYSVNHPQWPRNSKNILIFTINFEMSSPTPLTQFSKEELQKIFGHFNLEGPSMLKSKKTILALLEKQLLERFPTAETDETGSIILTPEMLQTE